MKKYETGLRIVRKPKSGGGGEFLMKKFGPLNMICHFNGSRTDLSIFLMSP